MTDPVCLAHQYSRRTLLQLPFTLLLALLIVSCSNAGSQPGRVSRLIGEEVREKHSVMIDIAQITDFDWEELYLFGPYEDRERICSLLGIDGVDCWWITPAIVEEGEYFFVFRKSGKITHIEYHWRINGDFSGAVLTQPILKSAARFSVHQSSVTADGQLWLRLAPVQIMGTD